MGLENEREILEPFLLLVKDEMRIMTTGSGIKYRT
jgi:hypothetical protein